MTRWRVFSCFLTVTVLSAILPLEVFSATSGSNGHARVSDVFFWLVLLLLAAKGGGELFERWNMPSVLGELVFGILLGNLTLLGYGGLAEIKYHPGFAFAAELGVILLLFEVGLESNLDELTEVGMSALLVAAVGVVAPMVLGYNVSSVFLPEADWIIHLFVGATLAATSVGITARVLKDLGKMRTREFRIILAAAVLDDVFGLVILATLSGLATSISLGGAMSLSFTPLMIILAKAIGFLLIAVVLGRLLAGRVLKWGARFKVAGMPVVLTLCYCFVVAGLAELVGLAPIMGAFAAGLVLDKTHYQDYKRMESVKVEEVLGPINSILVPVFFVLMGFRVDLSAFTSIPVLMFSGALCVAAIIGKQVCSLGVAEKGLNRLAIGVGMIPRGEVGLIFAGIGAATTINGIPIFNAETFSAVVLMVVVTTLITPPLLTFLFRGSTHGDGQTHSKNSLLPG